MRSLLVPLFLLVSPAAFGQGRQVRIIRQQVRAISRDTLRRVDFSRAMYPPDTVRRRLRVRTLANQYIAYYSPAGLLQEVEIKQPMPYQFASADTRYYLVNGEVVYVDTDYVNASRMGSCGQIRFHNRYFVRRQQLLRAELSEPPTGPYKGCYPVAPAAELARLLQELQPVLARVPAYRAER